MVWRLVVPLAVIAVGCGEPSVSAREVEQQVNEFYARERPGYVAREVSCVREEDSERSFRCGGEMASAGDGEASAPLSASVLVDDGRYLVTDQTDYRAINAAAEQNAREREQLAQAQQEAEEEAQEQALGEIESRLAKRIEQDFADAAEDAGADPLPSVSCEQPTGSASEWTCRVSFTFGVIPGDGQDVSVTVDGDDLRYDRDAVRLALNAMADARGG